MIHTSNESYLCTATRTLTPTTRVTLVTGIIYIDLAVTAHLCVSVPPVQLIRPQLFTMNALASSSSSDEPPFRPPSPRRSGHASRFLISMRKSISQNLLTPSRKRNTDHLVSEPYLLFHMILIHSILAVQHGGIGMYSTLEERNPSVPPRMHPRYRESSPTRPTIEQIAMGLHVSRTPHLRHPCHQPHSSPSSPSHIRHPHNTHDPSALYRPTHSLPPPPSRSSLKKISTATTLNTHPPKSFASLGASPSSSTITSVGASDGTRSLLSLKFRISKLIRGYRSTPISPCITSVASSGSGSEGTRPTTPRKSVRFSTSVLALDNGNATES